jgi:phage shock protein C
VDRFEKAVQDLVGSATTEFSDRATAFLNETTSRIEREFSGAARASEDYRGRDAAARMRARRKARARTRSARVLERSPRLCRDEENAKIVGVCAGIANYYGVEAWVVRCVAVTGLLFFGSIVFPAYWIMYFVMDDPKKAEKRARREARRLGREEPMNTTRNSESSGNPRSNLRNVQSDLQEVELRLRRMETHVTSGRYELQRELHKIETEGPPATAGR